MLLLCVFYGIPHFFDSSSSFFFFPLKGLILFSFFLTQFEGLKTEPVKTAQFLKPSEAKDILWFLGSK